MGKLWLAYVLSRNSGGYGSGDLGFLALILFLIGGIGYAIYRVIAAVAGVAAAYPMFTLLVVGIIAFILSEGVADTKPRSAGAFGIAMIVFFGIFAAGETMVSLPEIIRDVVILGWGISYIAFLWGLVRYEPTGPISRGCRFFSLTFIFWAGITGAVHAQLVWQISPTEVLVFGTGLGVIVGVWGLLDPQKLFATGIQPTTETS